MMYTNNMKIICYAVPDNTSTLGSAQSEYCNRLNLIDVVKKNIHSY